MKKITILGLLLTGLLASCGQQNTLVSQPITEVNIEKNESIISQQSLVSWLVKKGVTKLYKKNIQDAIENNIKNVINRYSDDITAKSFIQEADDIMMSLNDPWWLQAINFIPVVGDVVDLTRAPIKIKNAINKADTLYNNVKKYDSNIISARKIWNNTDSLLSYHYKKHALCKNIDLLTYIKNGNNFLGTINNSGIKKESIATNFGQGSKYTNAITKEFIITDPLGKIITYGKGSSCF